MKNLSRYILTVACVIVGQLLSSCVTGSSEEQWKSDHTRYDQQLKHYPDRESSDQEKADALAARKARDSLE
jgi:hypothetical protein